MRVLATLMLMISLVAMTMQTAAAQISQPSCTAQLRADPMCYPAALTPAQVEPAKKQGMCCDLLPAAMPTPHAGAGGITPHPAKAGLHVLSFPPFPPWRPPRG